MYNFNEVENYLTMVGDMFNVDFNTALKVKNYNLLRVNAIKNKNEFIIDVLSPTGNGKDVNVKIEKDQIIISVEKPELVTDEDVNSETIINEFKFEKIERIFIIPKIVNQPKISAKVELGILQIVCPILEEAKPRIVKPE